MTESSVSRRSFLVGATAAGIGGGALLISPTTVHAKSSKSRSPKHHQTSTTTTSTTSTTSSTTAPPASTGQWDDPTSWADGRVPGPTDIAVIDRHITGSGAIAVGAIRIEATGTLEFDPTRATTIEVHGNVVNAGWLVMRPSAEAISHRLRFVGVNEAGFVGGGMSVLDSDVGLWVIENGVLDAQGANRAGWNRTGDDPTWLDTDELVTAPNARGDLTTFAAHRRGAVVPTVEGPNGSVPTEVLNLTRNVWIEGTPEGRAHIMFLHCKQPQTIRHIGIRHMGPRQAASEFTEGVAGRYGLHFHHCGDGTRGSTVEGVVVRDGGFRAFVPHTSHGITFRDCIAFDVFDAGYWWDPDEETHDVTYDHCAAMLVRTDPDFRGYTTVGFMHGEGLNTTARDCVAVGIRSRKVNGGAFMWPSSANHGSNVWTFENCVAHNNRDAGFGVWQNDHNPHVMSGLIAYHNGIGISHGAYINDYTVRDGMTFANDTELVQYALRQTYERMVFDGDIRITHHSLLSTDPSRYVDCTFGGSIIIDEAGKEPGVIRFESSDRRFDLSPDLFVVRSMLSTITAQNSDGSTFVVT